jgi:hypothetical protein
VQFDTKIAVVLRDDLLGWQKTNVTAFLVSGIAGTVPGVVGEAYRDASGNEYLPMFVQPVLVYEANADSLRRAFERAMSRGVTPAIYTQELFATNHDEANRAAVASVSAEDLDWSGLPSAPSARRWTRSSTACASTPERRSSSGRDATTTPLSPTPFGLEPVAEVRRGASPDQAPG